MFAIKPTDYSTPVKIVKVGIIGCGMVTQVVHIPTLSFLSQLFQITYLCDVSNDALKHCQSKVASTPPKCTRSAEELCCSSDVDLVLIANNDTFHTPHALLALKNSKMVFVEKPLALTLEDCDRIIETEKEAGGNKVFVGYMRRYAAAFADAVKEVGSIENIRYARVRDIIGPNSVFVPQSGTFPRTFNDYLPEDSAQLKRQTDQNISQALQTELGLPVSESLSLMWNLLSGLGSHDLSAMRELLGMPEKVLGASLCLTSGSPFWSALFQYQGFAVSYESGIDKVPRFDASIEIFGDSKTVKVVFDTPFVKGLPTTMQVQESLPDGSYRNSTIRRTYEDPYTLEMKEVYEFVVNRKAPKTTPADAREDVQISGMILKAASLTL